MIFNNIFPLADSLQLELKVYQQGTTYELRGERDFVFPLGKTTDLKAKIKVEASTVGTNSASILVKVLKHLWVFLAYDKLAEENKQLTFYCLDMKNQNIKSIKKAVSGFDLETAMMSIRPLSRSTFTKGVNDTSWEMVQKKAVARVPKIVTPEQPITLD